MIWRGNRRHNGTATTRCSTRRIPDYTPCGYCFQEYATTWDHILPFSRGGATTPDNLMPACGRCNRLLSDRLFATIDEKREFVRARMIHDGKWAPPSRCDGDDADNLYKYLGP